MSTAAPTELDDLERHIASLQLTADRRVKDLAKMNYNQAHEFQTQVLDKLEELKAKRRRLLGARKAAATRAANKAAAR